MATAPGTGTRRLSDRLPAELPGAAHGAGRIVLTTEDGEPFSDAQKEQVVVALRDVQNVDGVETVLNPFSVHAERTDRLQQLDDGREEARRAEQRLDDAQVRLDTGQDRLDDARRHAERAAGSDDGRAFRAAERPSAT